MRTNPHHVQIWPRSTHRAVGLGRSATDGSAVSAPCSFICCQPSDLPNDGGEETPAVLLLDGPPGTRSIWHWVLPVLRSRGVQPCIVKRPDTGGPTGQAKDPFGQAKDPFSTAAEIARLLYDRRGPALIVGHGVGAGTALALAAGFSRYVRALVLVAPVAGLPSISIADRLLATPVVGPVVTWLGFRLAGVALHLPALRRAILTTRAGLSTVQAKQIVTHLTFGSTWRTFASDQRRLVSESRRRKQLMSLIDCPVLVVHGSRDRTVPRRTSAALRRLAPGADVITIAATGHVIPIDDPDSVADAVLHALRHEYRASLSARPVNECSNADRRTP